MNFHEFMCSHEAKNNKNLNNLLNRFFLMHPNYVLCMITNNLNICGNSLLDFWFPNFLKKLT
jgi:hypothetical protein